MTIKLTDEKRGFAKSDFEPLRLHYKGQALQIHVMAEFAQRGFDNMADALRLALDYFSLTQEAFLSRWLPEKGQGNRAGDHARILAGNRRKPQ